MTYAHIYCELCKKVVDEDSSSKTLSTRMEKHLKTHPVLLKRFEEIHEEYNTAYGRYVDQMQSEISSKIQFVLGKPEEAIK